MVDDKLSAQIDFAKWIIDHNQSWINLVDTKAGVILAADAAILILLGGSSLSVNSVYDRILLEVTLTLVSASALFGFMVITPRTKAGAPATNIFFASILTKSREEYQN